MLHFEDSIKEFNGEQIFCRHLKPKNGKDPKCVVFLCHGYGEHIGRYDDLFELLTNEDMYVFGHDHVGHGKSTGYRAWVEHYDVFSIPAKMHIQETMARFPGKKLFIYAHSMGGLISLKLLVNNPNLADGLVLEGPFLGIPECLPRWQVSIVLTLGRIWYLRALPASKMNSALISHDTNLIQSFEADPLAYHGWINMLFGASSMDAKDEVFSKIDKLCLPMLVAHGDSDQLSPISGAKAMFEATPSEDKTFKGFEGGYHVLRNEPYNGIGAAVSKTVVDWINARC